MPGKSHARSEQKALRFSLYGIIGFVVLALGFALLTNSDAILFDGIYSLIAFCVTLLTIKVAKLYQVENKLNAVLDYQLASQIPMIATPAR